MVKLATESHLGKLRELSLLDCELGDEGVEAIASSPLFANLELLNIGDTKVTADGIRMLAESKTLKKLQHVRVSHQQSAAFRAALAALEQRLVPGWDGRRWEPYC